MKIINDYLAPMDERRGSLTPLKQILDRMFKEGGLPFDMENGRIWKVWDEVVGPPVARHAKPLWVKRHVLRVGVSDPIWLQEIRFQEQDIREKLNRALGKEAVEKIEFRLGR